MSSGLAQNDSKKSPPFVEKEIFTSKKHAMEYFDVQGVILRTGYDDKRDWYLLPIREMLDNSADFLWKYYKDAQVGKPSITVSVKMDDEKFFLIINNSNYNNIPVFPNLQAIFDYDMRYGSKQDMHIISRGMLGDAMKQILSLGYVLLHTSDDGTAFTDKQWDYPLTIHHNGKEYKIHLHVDKAAQNAKYKIESSPVQVPHTDTEIELVLPVIDEVRNRLNRDFIAKFCRKYSLFTTDISFKFSIIDDINHISPIKDDSEDADIYISEKHDGSDDNIINNELITALRTTPEKGILNIEVTSIGRISTNWKNNNFIHSYKPEEFKNRIINVHDKNISVYEALQTFREGAWIKKNAENEISINDLLSKPDKDKRMEKFFHELRETAKSPPEELSLPYKVPKNRGEALYSRLSSFYDVDASHGYSYKMVRGMVNTGQFVEYPIAIELIASPLNNPLPDHTTRTAKKTTIITAVNYSVSPKKNIFEAKYSWQDDKYDFTRDAPDIDQVLRYHGFGRFPARKGAKLPCIMAINLITPRRDPIGYDKSKIDAQPFAEIILKVIGKMAKEIKTYRAAGITFTSLDDDAIARHSDGQKKNSAKELIRQFLIKERGLRDVGAY